MVPDEADRIRRAIDDHLSGKSLNQIAREWNEAGAKTTRGNPFSPITVRRILGNPIHAGLLSVDGEVKPGNWEPIIDRATHEAIRQKFMARRGQGERWWATGQEPAHRDAPLRLLRWRSLLAGECPRVAGIRPRGQSGESTL